MSLHMPRFIRRLDRALILRHPMLWLTRTHLVVLLGVPASLLLWLIGYGLPVGIRPSYDSSRYLSHTAWGLTFGVTLTATTLLTLYYVFVQARDRRLLPFQGRLWSFPLYAACVITLNAGPFLMTVAYQATARQAAWRNGAHYFPVFDTEIMIFPAVIALELVAFLTAARGVSIREVFVTFFALLIGIGGLLVASANDIISLQVLGAGVAIAYAGCAVFALFPLRLGRTTTPRMVAAFHLLTPFLAVFGAFAVDVDASAADVLAAFTVVGVTYTLLSYPLELRLTRLRALPE